MLHRDRVLLGPTPVDIEALLALDAGVRSPTSSESDELRAKGWLDPQCAVPLITIEGRVLLDRLALYDPHHNGLR